MGDKRTRKYNDLNSNTPQQWSVRFKTLSAELELNVPDDDSDYESDELWCSDDKVNDMMAASEDRMKIVASEQFYKWQYYSNYVKYVCEKYYILCLKS